LQVGGVGVFRANNLGVLFLNGGSTGSVARRSDVDMLMLHSANTTHGVIGIGAAGYNHGINITSTASLAWTNDTPAATRDVVLLRDAANTLALRNSTNAQAFNIYNTYTSGSVYERGFMRWVSNVLEIGTEHVGATGRAIKLKATGAVTLDNGGNSAPQLTFTPNSGAAFSLGMANGGSMLLWFNGGTVFGSLSNGIRIRNDGQFAFGVSTDPTSTTDVSILRKIANVVGIAKGDGGSGGALSFDEMTSPAAPATNGVYIFAEDNGAGKTRLMARFATGATQQLAIEP